MRAVTPDSRAVAGGVMGCQSLGRTQERSVTRVYEGIKLSPNTYLILEICSTESLSHNIQDLYRPQRSNQL